MPSIVEQWAGRAEGAGPAGLDPFTVGDGLPRPGCMVSVRSSGFALRYDPGCGTTLDATSPGKADIPHAFIITGRAARVNLGKWVSRCVSPFRRSRWDPRNRA